MTAIPIPEFITSLEVDLKSGRYWLHPDTCADYLELLRQIRVAASQGDRQAIVRLVGEVQLIIAQSREAITQELAALALEVCRPEGNA